MDAIDALTQTEQHLVERDVSPTILERRTVTGKDGTQVVSTLDVQTSTSAAATKVLTTSLPDGRTSVTTEKADPIFGLAAPLAKATTTIPLTSGALARTVAQSASLVPENATWQTMTSRTDTASITGTGGSLTTSASTWTRVLTRNGDGTTTIEVTSPELRKFRVVLYENGRVKSSSLTQYVYGTRVNVPEYAIRGTEVYRLVTDHLGSLRLVVRVSDKTIMQRMEYDAFGVVGTDYIASGWDPLPFGFAGGLYDRDTKLVRFGARDYEPQTGRWTAKDPAGFRGGLNLYAYCDNDPVNFRDFTGRWKAPAGPQGPFPPDAPQDLVHDGGRHQYPNGVRWEHPSGWKLDFHHPHPKPGQVRGHGTVPHWHVYDQNGDKVGDYEPGDEIPDFPSACSSQSSPANYTPVDSPFNSYGPFEEGLYHFPDMGPFSTPPTWDDGTPFVPFTPMPFPAPWAPLPGYAGTPAYAP